MHRQQICDTLAASKATPNQRAEVTLILDPRRHDRNHCRKHLILTIAQVETPSIVRRPQVRFVSTSRPNAIRPAHHPRNARPRRPHRKCGGRTTHLPQENFPEAVFVANMRLQAKKPAKRTDVQERRNSGNDICTRERAKDVADIETEAPGRNTSRNP